MANRSVDAAMPFDVALIACGGLGMPLGAHLRATNRSAMYNGGDLQLWFGCACAVRAEPNAPNKEIDLFDRLARRIRVYGKRWWGLGKMNLTFVENWVRPSAAETPAGASAVEGGTYW